MATALAGIGGGSALAGAATVATVGLGVKTTLDARKAEKNKRKELASSQAQAQQKFRDALRSGRSDKGTGDFRSDATGGVGKFDTALRQLTGR